MNQTDFPSLNNAVDGFVFRKPESTDPSSVDRKALELASIDLIAKLENRLAKAREMPRVDFVDESATIGRQMLELLAGFSQKFLSNEAAEQANEEINKATTASYAFDEVIKTRPLTNAIMRTFWKAEESPDIQTSHEQLGEALIRSCAATFYHTVMLIGLSTPFGKEIDQSTVVFVNELKQAWN